MTEIDHSFLIFGDGKAPLLSIRAGVAQSRVDCIALSLDVEHQGCGFFLHTTLEIEVEVLVLGGSEGDLNRQPAIDRCNFNCSIHVGFSLSL